MSASKNRLTGSVRTKLTLSLCKLLVDKLTKKSILHGVAMLVSSVLQGGEKKGKVISVCAKY